VDDKHFQEWTEILGELRSSRLEEVGRRSADKAIPFNPENLFKIYATHFNVLLSKWWDLEKQSWENSPPADLKLGVDTLKNELESLLDLELEKIQEEIDEVRETETSWHPDEFESAKKNFQKIAHDYVSNYSLKIEILGGKSKKDVAVGTVVRPKISGRPAGGSSAGAGGIWLLFMFLIGILLGAAPTVYYWDLARKNEEKLDEELAKLSLEKKGVLSKLAVLQEAYRELAHGKTQNIPELQNTIGPIRRSFAKSREQLERDYVKKQTEFLKRIPAGDRQDKSLKALKEATNKERQALLAAEERQLEPLLNELRKHQQILEGLE